RWQMSAAGGILAGLVILLRSHAGNVVSIHAAHYSVGRGMNANQTTSSLGASVGFEVLRRTLAQFQVLIDGAAVFTANFAIVYIVIADIVVRKRRRIDQTGIQVQAGKLFPLEFIARRGFI